MRVFAAVASALAACPGGAEIAGTNEAAETRAAAHALDARIVANGASVTSGNALILGLAQTITVPANSVVHVHSDGGVQSTGATSTSYSVVDIGLFVDGVVSSSAGQRRLSIANTAALSQLIANWSIDRTYALPAGSHTFEVRAVNGASGTSAANVSSGSAPQLMGVLTVTVINK
ncbi:hypothetical protein [Tahibacter caeni]|uniref:hypothetical protein n=1 Tax=Tahibacter caeni TaxID=1453545 RepID=UPI002148A414|nr:hypothetical protein [Tahibacter caeni]